MDKWISAKLDMNMNQSELRSDRSRLLSQLFRYIKENNSDSLVKKFLSK